MNLQIYRTADGTKSYPKHSHTSWEILIYLEGEGFLYTYDRNIPFKPGTIILVPPKIIHCSVAENNFKNISVCGDFNNIIFFDELVCTEDNEDKDGTVLAKLLFKNRKSDTAYINSLANTYVRFLLDRISVKNPIYSTVNEIITIILEKFDDPNINISEIMSSFNHTKDYIRRQFKKITGMHPIEFLTKCRIEQATFLIDVYGNTLSLSQIAEKCGYLDYVYFSKQFKAIKHISPQKYRQTLKVE